MSLAELAVILGGGVAGWLIVSFVMSRGKSAVPTAEPGHWFEILGVAPSANRQDVERAYAERCATLERQKLRIMTELEEQRTGEQLTRLETSYRAALRYLDERAEGADR